MADTHFDIPGPVRTIECRIAPTQTGGIYYTGPSDDFTRPGRMWWSVPKGVTEFGTWRELTTVYHEGVPGHHLQVAQTVYRRELLNRWRRMMCWVSGHGEGWALYAERLMAELGYMDDPGNCMACSTASRCAPPASCSTSGCTAASRRPPSSAAATGPTTRPGPSSSAHANHGEESMRFELDRYLGWPGQAPSLQDRRAALAAAARRGRPARAMPSSLKDFHRRALDLGSVGLDVMREAILA